MYNTNNMLNEFFTTKDKKNEAIKTFIIKEFFNSTNQKKVITRAARESAEDQKMLVSRYRELIRR